MIVFIPVVIMSLFLTLLICILLRIYDSWKIITISIFIWIAMLSGAMIRDNQLSNGKLFKENASKINEFYIGGY